MVKNDLNSKVKNHEVEVTDSGTGAENTNNNLEPMCEVETESVTGGLVTKVSNPLFKRGDIHTKCPKCSKEIVFDSDELGLADGNQTHDHTCPGCGASLHSEFKFRHNRVFKNSVSGTTKTSDTTKNRFPYFVGGLCGGKIK